MPKSPPISVRLEAETYKTLKKQADSTGTPLAKVVASLVEKSLEKDRTLERMKMLLTVIEDNQNELRDDIASACTAIIASRPYFGSKTKEEEEKGHKKATDIVARLDEKLTGARRVTLKYDPKDL